MSEKKPYLIVNVAASCTRDSDDAFGFSHWDSKGGAIYKVQGRTNNEHFTIRIQDFFDHFSGVTFRRSA